jgi:glyoxylase-like metal-dependent hydrolase (beta-lactamase superfamily II)
MVSRRMSRAIDTMHLGREHVICAFQVGGLVVDPGPASCLDTLLEGLDEEPRAVLLTHIHLDHAGATGVLARAYPGLTVYVHERGARHLADPSRLLRSAGMLYGDQMDTLWGEVAPVDPERIQALCGGERVEGMRVAATPGHASHHVCYLREETGEAFVGDMAGIRMPGSDYTVPPTPPPDIDMEAWLASVDRIEEWDASALCLTHFGPFDDVGPQLDRVRSALRARAERARDLSAEEFARWSEAETRAAVDEPTAASLLQAAPPDQLGRGLRRYWDKS